MENKITSDDFYGDMKKLAKEIKEKKDGDKRNKDNKSRRRSDQGKG